MLRRVPGTQFSLNTCLLLLLLLLFQSRINLWSFPGFWTSFVTSSGVIFQTLCIWGKCFALIAAPWALWHYKFEFVTFSSSSLLLAIVLFSIIPTLPPLVVTSWRKLSPGCSFFPPEAQLTVTGHGCADPVPAGADTAITVHLGLGSICIRFILQSTLCWHQK